MMGEFKVGFRIWGSRGEEHIEAQVVDRSAYLVLPRSIADRIGVMTFTRQEFDLREGGSVEADVGFAFMEFMGKRGPVNVAILDEDIKPRIGIFAITGLGFEVDLEEGRIEERMLRL